MNNKQKQFVKVLTIVTWYGFSFGFLIPALISQASTEAFTIGAVLAGLNIAVPSYKYLGK